MTILAKIKKNYHLNLLNDQIKSKNFQQIEEHLQKIIQTGNPLIFEFLEHVLSKTINNTEFENLFKKKIVWVNSFDLEDVGYINSFLDFYFSKVNSNFGKVQNYESILLNLLKNFPTKHHLGFEDFIHNSALYQFFILLNQKSPFVFLNTNAAFFEAPKNKQFTYTDFTQAYIYICSNPLKILKRYVDSGLSKNDAIIQVCNLDNNFFEHNIHDLKLDLSVEVNRQNWAINYNSWTDNNVNLTFQGHIIDNDDLFTSPEETLIELLSHLNVSGIDFEINYKYVKEFIENHEFSNQPSLEISNKEKKIILRELKLPSTEKILEKFF
tara:strand:+ start:141 stop:1115 length:975 start_codon:yes stop_codon:yes gene_type:complete